MNFVAFARKNGRFKKIMECLIGFFLVTIIGSFLFLRKPPSAGFINEQGQVVFTNKSIVAFSHVSNWPMTASKFSEGLCLLTDSRGDFFINKEGEDIFGQCFSRARHFSGGLAAVKVGTKWGYINLTGRLIIQPNYDSAGSFSNGFAAVRQEGRWGYIDQSGSWLQEPIFDSVLPFANGFAAVKVNGNVGYLGKSGKLVIEPRYVDGGSFSEGMARVVEFDRKENLYRVSYINTKGELKFEVKTLGMYQDSSSRAFARSEDNPFSLGFDDERDDIGLAKTDDMMVNGRVCILVERKFGFLDKNGKVAIPFVFEKATAFNDGLALVKTAVARNDNFGGYGFIDPAGEFVIPPIFSFARPFAGGLAYVEKGNGRVRGFIDKSGNFREPKTTEHRGLIGDFHEGLAAIEFYSRH